MYVVPSEAMEHAMLLGCDSSTRFGDRSYRTLAPAPGDNRVSGEITLSHTEQHGAALLVSHSSDPAGGLRLLYAGDTDISLSHDQPTRCSRFGSKQACSGPGRLLPRRLVPVHTVGRRRGVRTGRFSLRFRMLSAQACLSRLSCSILDFPPHSPATLGARRLSSPGFR